VYPIWIRLKYRSENCLNSNEPGSSSQAFFLNRIS
jgi:hypothetical protein